MSETAGQKIADDVTALLRARNALIWVVTPEEGRVERALVEAVAKAKFEAVRIWDCANGVVDALGNEVAGGRSLTEAPAVLGRIRETKERGVWILRDLPFWLRDPVTLRALRSLARSLQSEKANEFRAVIVLSPSAEVPPELADHAVVIKWQLPDRAEIASIFDRVMGDIEPEIAAAAVAWGEGIREQAIEAAVGLSAEAAASCYAKSLVTQKRRIVPSAIAAEKKRVVNKEKGIEWTDPDPRGLAAVGGLENLKQWLTARRAAFSERARAFGLPMPRGMLLVGLPGGGKSLTAKAVAAAWGVPLLKLDLGGTRSKWVGESEGNIRAALAVADAVGNCVVWLDEIEKALGGATSGAADGGVSSDALGTLLSWMQERKGSVFVVATANDVRALPPELLRKGRFDEVFWMGLPTQSEREDILRVTLRQYGRTDALTAGEVTMVTTACAGFVGAEIAALVPSALFAAFADGERQLTASDLLSEAGNTVPLSKTAAEKVKDLYQWAQGRARPASKEETGSGVKTDSRKLDFS